MITEEEAKTKWCPFARVIASCRGEGQSPSYNRLLLDDLTVRVCLPDSAMCIASACMAWRWAEKWGTLNDEYETGPLTRGYCGLAGKP